MASDRTLLDHCLRVVEERVNQNIESSAREVYYRLVGLGIVEQDKKETGSRKNYIRVVNTIAKAKLRGDFPLEWLRDNLRVPGEGDISTPIRTTEEALDEAVDYFNWLPGHLIQPSKWYQQPIVPHVMVEKDTLEGTIRGPCKEYDVPWYVCRGYSSITGLYAWAKQVHDDYENADWPYEVVVLYMGDHDPEGLNIPDAAERVICRISELSRWDMPTITFERIALTKEQAIELNAPPMQVKMSSARAAGYVEEHGTKTWEIEAMDAVALRDLLDDQIRGYFDDSIPESFEAMIEERRDELRERMRDEARELMRRAFG